MTDYTLTIPEDIYDHARQIAADTAQPIDDVLIDCLRGLTPTPEEQAELDALAYLSNDALLTIAREELSEHLCGRLQLLMDENMVGGLTANEFAELQSLIERNQRVLMRRSEARKLLAYRLSPVHVADVRS